VSSENKNEVDYEAIDTEIEAVFVRVKNEYARTLPKKLAELESVIDSARAEPDQPELFTNALNELHRMKGTLGSYDFPELARLVASVEKLLRQNTDGLDPKALSSSFWEQLNPQIAAIWAEGNKQAREISDSAANT
jgi:HPt (histidine-containing phosphotransfer) domain-containing protein